MTTAEAVTAVAAVDQLPSDEELAEYDGLWVAVSDGKVVGSGKSPQTAINRAVARGVEMPLLFRAPLRRKGRSYY
jgi:hypothetical protein